MGSNPLLMIGLMAAVGVALNFARMWLFVSAASAPGKASRIAEHDSHLSFDERIAERMRELEKEQGAGSATPTSAPAAPSTPFAPPAPAALQGFGRRRL